MRIVVEKNISNGINQKGLRLRLKHIIKMDVLF